jgi:hypothetical protein
MMERVEVNDDWVKLSGTVSAQDIRELSKLGDIDKLSIVQESLLTAEVARGLSALKSVRLLWLWCDVTRTAMRHVLAIPNLQVLDVLHIRYPGRLQSFQRATSLQEFRCNTGLAEDDLLEIATCHSLREIGAQSSEISPKVIDAFLRMPSLISLDIEGSNFNDGMAGHLCRSSQLRFLDIGATTVTGAGLKAISKMRQLTSLDLWATAIDEADIDVLTQLPNLEYLSVGHVEGTSTFSGNTLLPRLSAIPSLRRIWLDGVALSAEQKRFLHATYQDARLT